MAPDYSRHMGKAEIYFEHILGIIVFDGSFEIVDNLEDQVSLKEKYHAEKKADENQRKKIH